MTRILPPHPNLDHLKNEAKALLKSHKAGELAAYKTLRLLHRFRDSSDEQILAANLALHETQFALAMDYGFKNWEDLREHVLSLEPDANFEVEPLPGVFLLENPPAGRSNINRFAHAFQMLFSYCGQACDYTTVMGDSGLAFILQADTKHTAWGKPVDQLDIGWWPLDQWGAMMRVGFVGKAAGISLRFLPFNDDEYRADAAESYRRRFHTAVIETLHSGRPPVAVWRDVYLVAGYDDGKPPLLGQCSCLPGHKIERLKGYPWRVVVPGQPIKPIDRLQADVEALNFAVAVVRDRLGRTAPPNKCSGQKSFALWTRLLRDSDHWGAHFYHANVVGHLHINRQSAGPYLRAMAERHKGAAASHLLAAANTYGNVLKALAEADTSKQIMSSPEGREKLAEMVDKIAALEVTAADEMEKALAVIK